MKQNAVFRLLFMLILFYALAMVVPLIIAFVLSDTEMIRGFGFTITFSAATALPAFLTTRKQ
ncbi:MAG: hypothetical protein LBH07_02660, partial [Treponema sp.]|nr:hypothetical protein [Treponema sp.]